MAEFSDYGQFDPMGYLEAYYGSLGPEAEGLLAFLVDLFAKQPANRRVLDFGGGPTLIGLIPAARRATDIHFCDYVAANRNAVQQWLCGNETGFDWRPFIARCLELEGGESSVEDRVRAIRRAVKRVTPCDIHAKEPVDIRSHQPFDVIMSNYCVDAVTDSRDEWIGHMRKLKKLLRPGGTFAMANLLEAEYSNFEGRRFPNVYLTPASVHEALDFLGFEEIQVTTAPADHPGREYQGVIFSSARY